METEDLDGWRVVELLWPLNDAFRSRLPLISNTPYDPDFEAAADIAVEWYVEAPDEGAWEELPPEVWRVLLERHMQTIEMALVCEAMEEAVLSIPAGLDESDQRLVVIAALLAETELHREPADGVALELPKFPRGPPASGH